MKTPLHVIFIIFSLQAILPVGAGAQHPDNGPKQGQTWTVPFASKDNVIELTVANPPDQPVGNLTVRAGEVPSWMRLHNPEQAIGELGPGREMVARFTFDVEETAGVNQPAVLHIIVSNPDGFRQEKRLTLQVEAPREFELRQNYPNPFNPSTTIAFQLPAAAEIRLEVFDVLGRRVATLVEGQAFPAGGHTVPFDGASLASGLYLYRLSGQTSAGRSFLQTKKMMMVK
ncbi:MAG: T9SS type A sorting domain-containing protein [Balneolaceae bacterium]